MLLETENEINGEQRIVTVTESASATETETESMNGEIGVPHHALVRPSETPETFGIPRGTWTSVAQGATRETALHRPARHIPTLRWQAPRRIEAVE